MQVIDRFGIDTPKTARLRAILDTLGVRGKTVIVDARARRRAGALRAQPARRAASSTQTHLTVYDVLDCRHLVVSQDALAKLEARLGA